MKKNLVKTTFKGIKEKIVKSKPELLAIAGIGCFFGAIVATDRIAPKVAKKKKELPPDATWTEKFKVYKDYAVVGGLSAAGTACIWLSHKETGRRALSMNTAETLALAKVAENADARLKERIAAEKEAKVEDKVDEKIAEGKKDIVQSAVESDDVIWDTGNGRELFMDYYTGQLFYSSTLAVEEACMRFNNSILRFESASIGDWCDELQVLHNALGDSFMYGSSDRDGNIYEPLELRYSYDKLPNGQLYTVIRFNREPDLEWSLREYDHACHYGI